MPIKHTFLSLSPPFFFSVIFTVPGKVMTTPQAVKIITTCQEYESDVGEILSSSLNLHRIPQNLEALNFQVFVFLNLVLKWAPLIT